MKIVIISRAIHPMIAPRSLRATELAKEFSRKGHEVVLYGRTGKFDYSSFETKTGVKIKSIGKTLFSKINSDETYRYNGIDKLLKKMFGNILEFPDIELVRNVYKSLKKEKKIDLLITIAIPYPIHWGATLFRSIHNKRGLKFTWIADCGDPYMGNPMKKHPFYFKYIEKWFCKKADYLTVPIEEAREAYYPEFREKINVIPQGFNFDEVKIDHLYSRNNAPTFMYAGNFYKDFRNPGPFLDYLKTCSFPFRFIIYTRSYSILKAYKEVLGEKLIIKEFIPRKQLLVEMAQADFLINFENNTNKQSPSKLIDYALTKRPILNINTNQNLKVKQIAEFLNGNYSHALKIENLEQYNIRNIAEKFIKLIGQK